MAGQADDSQALRPEVVLLLLDTGQAADGIDDGAACHADGRLLDPAELALIKSRTPAEERAVGLDRRYPDWPKMPCVSVLTVLDRAGVIVIAGSQGGVTCCRTAWRSAAVRSV